MELNSKKLETTSRIVYYSISAILCLFLILLSNKIIDDLDTTIIRPQIENFENKTTLLGLSQTATTLDVELDNLNTKRNTIDKTIAIAKENSNIEKRSFDNWVQTRKTLGSPETDPEIIYRVKKLDNLYKIEQAWRLQLNSIQSEADKILDQQQKVQKLITKEKAITDVKFFHDLKRYELKVFLIRLLFIAPILILGIFFFIRYRKHKFWPLFFGFSLFSFYAFFFGLVPYLPSYGGYVRYAVGILLSAGLGYYAIKTIRKYIEQKQKELKVSTHERAKNVQTEVAEKALTNHFCPSCGKDFIINKWEFPIKNIEIEAYKLVTDFCRHCGLVLFTKCGICGNKNFAHISFCSSCGSKPVTNK
ncbi:MAG: hypothetical protein H7096_00075 [Flavobacterium sp.]|nr:hypothetical protein [Pedobacter sp.]